MKNQEAKQVRDIGSLIFETPIQHDYEVRSLLVTERLETIERRQAVTDVASCANRFVKFWVDDTPARPMGESTALRGEGSVLLRDTHPHTAVPQFLFLLRKMESAHRRHQREGTDHLQTILVGVLVLGALALVAVESSAYLEEEEFDTGLSPRIEVLQQRSSQSRPPLTPRIPPDNVPQEGPLLC